jgi:hypothetical protein
MYVDENGMPLERPPAVERDRSAPEEEEDPTARGTDIRAPQRMDQGWIDQVLGRDERRPTPQPRRPEPVGQ